MPAMNGPPKGHPHAHVPHREKGITKVIVHGFKSLGGPIPYEIEIRPLTILAGANSSGKSSVMQPLLLLKQTLEASYDPGPLLLDGPHVRFTSTGQILPVDSRTTAEGRFVAGLEVDHAAKLVSCFSSQGHRLALEEMEYSANAESFTLKESLSHEQIEKLLPSSFDGLKRTLEEVLWDVAPGDPRPRLKVLRRRCFFEIGIQYHDFQLNLLELDPSQRNEFAQRILRILHVPGLRGNPERSYRTTAVGSAFPGTFETYVASIIHHWQQEHSPKKQELREVLARLGLTGRVDAKQLDAARVEIMVGRLPATTGKGARDLVNIADVGFGVSQILPVVVALLKAEPGQLVYLEQPEIHLHPKAQVALAELLANAANRGVRVVAETHSALLVLAVQALMAEKELSPEAAILHWFRRDQDGVTKISTAELDQQGAYGDWPEDFGDVELSAQSRYMDAVEKQMFRVVGG